MPFSILCCRFLQHSLLYYYCMNHDQNRVVNEVNKYVETPMAPISLARFVDRRMWLPNCLSISLTSFSAHNLSCRCSVFSFLNENDWAANVESRKQAAAKYVRSFLSDFSRAWVALSHCVLMLAGRSRGCKAGGGRRGAKARDGFW